MRKFFSKYCGMLASLASADYHNAVFVGYDSSGKPRHAHKRGTSKEKLPLDSQL